MGNIFVQLVLSRGNFTFAAHIACIASVPVPSERAAQRSFSHLGCAKIGARTKRWT